MKNPIQKNAGCFNSTSITHQLAHNLGLRIVTGEFNDSQSLPSQKELCKEYGVSLITVREAIKMLHAKRMVYSRMSQGHKIEPEGYWNLLDPDILSWLVKRDFSNQLLREFNEVRYAIEPIATSTACQSSEENVKKLEVILKKIELLNINERDSKEVEIEFHVFILNLNENRLFQQFSHLVSIAHRYYYRSSRTNRNTNSEIKVQLYNSAYLAIKTRNVVDAKNSMKRLLVFFTNTKTSI